MPQIFVDPKLEQYCDVSVDEDRLGMALAGSGLTEEQIDVYSLSLAFRAAYRFTSASMCDTRNLTNTDKWWMSKVFRMPREQLDLPHPIVLYVDTLFRPSDTDALVGELTRSLAHESRHVWQYYNTPDFESRVSDAERLRAKLRSPRRMLGAVAFWGIVCEAPFLPGHVDWPLPGKPITDIAILAGSYVHNKSWDKEHLYFADPIEVEARKHAEFSQETDGGSAWQGIISVTKKV